MSIECWGKMPEKGVVFCCNKVRNTYKGIQLYRILVMVKGITAFKDGRAMYPVTLLCFRLTRATVEALRIFPFLDNDATIGGLFRELPQYIAATQDVVIECEGKKVEWWRVYEEGLPNWSSCCPPLWPFVDVRILRH